MILIAEDNPAVRRMIRSLVEEIDPQIIECEDGGTAVKMFEEHKPDWVLMDVHMRPVDGLTAMCTILERHPHARIVIVTQYADARTRETALAMGAHAFVGKADLMSIRDLIEEAMCAGKTERY
jgi:two-component system response regulator DegU